MIMEIIKANKLIIGAAAGGAVVGAGITEGINIAKNKRLAKDNELRLELIKQSLDDNVILGEEEKQAIIEEIAQIVARKKLSKDARKQYEETIGECKEQEEKETKEELEEEQSEEKEEEKEESKENNKNNNSKKNKNNK